VGVELLYADRRKDMRKLIVAFRNSANAPNNKHLEKHLRVISNIKRDK